MKLTKFVAVGALASLIASPTVLAESFDSAQTQAIQKIVHDYLVQNPQVLMEASNALQAQQQKEMQVNAKSAILQNADQLLNATTVAGNPKGTVTLVEFFDYQCGHCQKMSPIVHELMKSDSNLRVVYKEFPIFGKTSELASKAALAAAKQGKYEQMQSALFNLNKRFDEATVMEAAKSVGLNLPQLKKDMSSQAIADALAQNRNLAEKMKLMGTPAFVVIATTDGKIKANSEPAFIPGGASIDVLQKLIKQVAS